MSVENSREEEKRQAIARALGFLTEAEVAMLAGVKETTLCAWRKRGTGPDYVQFGKEPLYSLAALQRYLIELNSDVDRRRIMDSI